MASLTISGIKIFSNDGIVQAQLPTIIKAPKMLKYVANLDKSLLDITGIRIDAVKWFCNPNTPDPNKLGFIYMELLATDKRNGKPVPGVVFLRGGAVAVYLRVVVEGKKYVVLTRQLRAPIGGLLDEIPAGMMDDNSCFAGVAIKEIQEETGLVAPNINCLIELGTPIMPSAGGCDEEIQLYFWETRVKPEIMEKMKAKIFGAEHENESIRLIFISAEEYEDYLLTMSDVKAICAHQRAAQMGLLTDTCVKTNRCCRIS
jgi:ADP-sugar diphosphatase